MRGGMHWTPGGRGGEFREREREGKRGEGRGGAVGRGRRKIGRTGKY